MQRDTFDFHAIVVIYFSSAFFFVFDTVVKIKAEFVCSFFDFDDAAVVV